MKWLLVLLIIGGLGYVAYTHQDEIIAKVSEWRGVVTNAATAPATVSDNSTPGAPPAPTFQSKIEVPPAPPGEKQLAPPGTFYMKTRAKHDTDSGIVAVGPAEPVNCSNG